MTSRIPAQVGMALAEVETPALLIDLDALERNVERLASDLASSDVRVRTHAKTHKSPAIARLQIAAGAVGVCCQTVGEAEIMTQGGIDDVLVTNVVVDPAKILRLAALARLCRVGVCVDDESNVNALDDAAERMGVGLHVLVEIDVGSEQCGIAPDDALSLGRTITESRRLRFGGLQAYHGRAQHLRTHQEREAAVKRAIDLVKRAAATLERGGIQCETITGAGTGTYPIEVKSRLYTEIQPGSYVFMDADYAKNRNRDGTAFDRFENSLFVWTTVISRPTPDRAIVNAGKKTVSVDSGMPLVHGVPRATYAGAADEHGRLVLSPNNETLAVGEKIRLVPGHCDPTVNLFDWYVGYRGDRVECLWPIEARGASI